VKPRNRGLIEYLKNILLIIQDENGRHDADYGRHDDCGRHDAAPTTATTGKIMGYYKYQTTKEINIPGHQDMFYKMDKV